MSQLQPYSQTSPLTTYLPQEVINSIVTFITHKPTLSHLTQTCRLFRDIYQPTLYHSFHHNHDSFKNPLTSLTRVITFIRTLIARPDLAASVKYLDFNWPPDATFLPSESEEINFLTTSIRELGLDLPYGEANWSYEAPHALVPFELILAFTCNVETLTIMINDGWSLELVPQYLQQQQQLNTSAVSSGAGDRKYQRLKHLTVDYQFIAGDRLALTSDHWLPFVILAPNLESFCVPNTDCFSESDSARVPQMKKLQVLDFGTDCMSNEVLITTLVRSAKALRRVQLEWVGCNSYDDDTSVEEYSVVRVWDALWSVRTYLEDVTFNYIDEIPLGDVVLMRRGDGNVSSLVEFSRLRVLKTSGRSLEAFRQAYDLKSIATRSVDLFARQLFPQSIEVITIYDPSSSLIPLLLAIADWKSRGEYLNLRRLEIAQSMMWEAGGQVLDWIVQREWMEREEEVKRCLESVKGLEFVITVKADWFVAGRESFKRYARKVEEERRRYTYRGW